MPPPRGRSIALLTRRVRGEHFARSGGVERPVVDDDAEAEAQRLAGLDREAAVARFVVFEIVHPENIGGEETVIARVPIRRMARIAWVVEDRDPDGMTVNIAGEVGPFRALAPHQLLARFVLRIDELAGALRLRDSFRLLRLQRRGQPD